ncbi:MAG TPA: hypothetical protein VJU84_00045 [Pyrinomonadaceae bacterium]|nr:hypothetical protein [Pyrinomonadaceae bacterium]
MSAEAISEEEQKKKNQKPEEKKDTAQRVASAEVSAATPEPLANYPLTEETYTTGVFSMVTITLYDQRGEQITDFTAVESVKTIEGDPVVQNPRNVSGNDGTVKDLVGAGDTHRQQVSGAQARAIVQRENGTPRRSVTEMTLTVNLPSGTSANVVFQRTFTNLEGGKLRTPVASRPGGVKVNHTISVTAATVRPN